MSKQRMRKAAQSAVNMFSQTLVLRADNSRQLFDGTKTTEELRQLVGGYVEVTTCMYEGRKRQMVVNEDGHQLRLPYNRHATEMWAQINPVPQAIFGDAVVLLNWALD